MYLTTEFMHLNASLMDQVEGSRVSCTKPDIIKDFIYTVGELPCYAVMFLPSLKSRLMDIPWDLMLSGISKQVKSSVSSQ